MQSTKKNKTCRIFTYRCPLRLKREHSKRFSQSAYINIIRSLWGCYVCSRRTHAMSEVGMKMDGVGGWGGRMALLLYHPPQESCSRPQDLFFWHTGRCQEWNSFFFFFKVPASSSLVSGASKLVGHIRLRVAGCSLHHWLRLQQRAETFWFSPEKLCTAEIVSLPDCVSIKQVIKGIPYWHGYDLSLFICWFRFWLVCASYTKFSNLKNKHGFYKPRLQ